MIFNHLNKNQPEQFHIGNFAVLNTDEISTSSVYLMDGGIEHRYQENYYFQNNKRSNYSGYIFQYTLSGTGIFLKNETPHPIEKGKGFLVSIPENTAYYLPKNSQKPWQFIYLHFGGEMLSLFASRIQDLNDGIFSLDISSKTIQMALQLQEKMILGEKLLPYESSEFTYSFFCTFLRELEFFNSREKLSLAAKGKEILERDFHHIEGIEALAEQLGVSQEHFCRVFKKEIKITPGQYLNYLRIQASMCDLLNTNDNIEIIAVRNGFSTANYFCKVFRRHVGTSPMQYRNMK